MRVLALFLALCIVCDHAAGSVSITTDFMAEIAAALASAPAGPLVMQIDSAGPIGGCDDATIDLANTAATSITIELAPLRGDPGMVDCAGQVRTTPMFTCDGCPPTVFRSFHFSDLASTNPNVAYSVNAAFIEVLDGTVTLEDMTFADMILTPASFPGALYECVDGASMMTFVTVVGATSHLIVSDTFFRDSDVLHGWIVTDDEATATLSDVSFVGNDVARCFGALVVANGTSVTAIDCLFDSNAVFGAGNWFHESEVAVYGDSTLSLTNSQYSTANSQYGFLSAGEYFDMAASVTIDGFTRLDFPHEDHQTLFYLLDTQFTLSNSAFPNMSDSFSLDQLILAAGGSHLELTDISFGVPLVGLYDDASISLVDCTFDYPLNDDVDYLMDSEYDARGDIQISNCVFNGYWSFEIDGIHNFEFSGCTFDNIYEIDYYGDGGVIVVENSNVVNAYDGFFYVSGAVETISFINVNYSGYDYFAELYDFESASISHCNFNHVGSSILYSSGGNISITNSNFNDCDGYVFYDYSEGTITLHDVTFDDVFAVGYTASNVDARNIVFRNQKDTPYSSVRGGYCIDNDEAIFAFSRNMGVFRMESSVFQNIQSRILVANAELADVTLDGITVSHASDPLFSIYDNAYETYGESTFRLQNSVFDDVASLGYFFINSAITNVVFINQPEHPTGPCQHSVETDVFFFSGYTANRIESSRFETIPNRAIYADGSAVVLVNVNMTETGIVATMDRGYLTLENVNIEHVSGISPYLSYSYWRGDGGGKGGGEIELL